MDEQNDIKNKLSALSKKDSKSYMAKDLGDVVYENQKNALKQFFVNTHGSELMTTLLTVVPKKMVQKFMDTYMSMLVTHNKSDLENWTKRARANLTH